RGRLTEQPDESVTAESHLRPHAVEEHTLGERHRKTAVGDVVRSREQAFIGSLTHQRRQRALGVEPHPRWQTAEMTVCDPCPLGAVELVRRLTEEQYDVVHPDETAREAPRDVVDDSEDTY